MQVAVLGSGAWGTMLATMLADKGVATILWEHREERARILQRERFNTRFLPDIMLPPSLAVTANIIAAVEQADVVLVVTPTQQTRANARLFIPHMRSSAFIISASKGFELATGARVSQILQDELPEDMHERIAVLSGPNLAHEIAEGKPAASVIACHDEQIACQARELLTTATLRVYSTDDVIGVEIGGALKNVIAIAIGISDGLSFGANTKATLMTRGIAEIVRLAVAEGANPLTLAGLAGLGDLIATCSSTLSRNYSLGYEMASTGQSLDTILAHRYSVAEGVATARAALLMAERHGIQMPITQALCNFFDGQDARTILTSLMRRDLRPERDLEPDS
jgi:glycerol-3-phosphate dehydrogenase (NAD(P)+)